MFLKKISIDRYKVLEDVSINFEPSEYNVFPVISTNGGGKSTLLQTVFAFLHCPFNETRKKHAQNFLENLPSAEGITKLIGFELDYNGESVSLEFHYCSNNDPGLPFDAVLRLQRLKDTFKKSNESIRSLARLQELESDMKLNRVSEHIIGRELKEFSQYISSAYEERIIRGEYKSKEEYANVIENIKKRVSSEVVTDEEINFEITKTEVEISKMNEALEKKGGFRYALHFKNNQGVLLYKTDAKNDILKEISDKVYLAMPNTQILHLLSGEQLNLFFNNKTSHYSLTTYERSLKDCQKELTGLFTYEFSVLNLVTEAFKKARDTDFENLINKGSYGDEVNKTREEMNTLLTGKKINIDADFSSVYFTNGENGQRLYPKDLSHGELRKLCIYIWVKSIPDGSLVLMDEVDMALHPIWQHSIAEDLKKWNPSSQFVVATHSPQIISLMPYKNLVALYPKPGGSGASSRQFTQPHLDVDINTIVKTIMGGEYIPKKIAELHKEYRSYVDKHEENTEAALAVKQQLLEFESEGSDFFQEVKFDIKLR